MCNELRRRGGGGGWVGGEEGRGGGMQPSFEERASVYYSVYLLDTTAFRL